MSGFEKKAQDFLAQKRIAIAGASAQKTATGNAIYRAFKSRGYEVFPIHPSAKTVEGDTAYAHLKDIPGGVDGLFIATNPDASFKLVQQASEAGVPRVWMHYNALFNEGTSSVSQKAVAYCKEKNIQVIDGGCPMMFFDFSHKCMKWILDRMNKLPE